MSKVHPKLHKNGNTWDCYADFTLISEDDESFGGEFNGTLNSTPPPYFSCLHKLHNHHIILTRKFANPTNNFLQNIFQFAIYNALGSDGKHYKPTNSVNEPDFLSHETSDRYPGPRFVIHLPNAEPEECPGFTLDELASGSLSSNCTVFHQLLVGLFLMHYNNK